jgi:hypothetical protein
MPMTASTTNTVIKPSQNGSCNILSDSGRYGIFIRRSHFGPSNHAKHLDKFIIIEKLKIDKLINFPHQLPALVAAVFLDTLATILARIIIAWLLPLITYRAQIARLTVTLFINN